MKHARSQLREARLGKEHIVHAPSLQLFGLGGTSVRRKKACNFLKHSALKKRSEKRFNNINSVGKLPKSNHTSLAIVGSLKIRNTIPYLALKDKKILLKQKTSTKKTNVKIVYRKCALIFRHWAVIFKKY